MIQYSDEYEYESEKVKAIEKKLLMFLNKYSEDTVKNVQRNIKSWTKGQSGNPKGKPKGAKNRSTIIKEILSLMVKKVDADGKAVWQSKEYLMVEALVNKAIDKGDVNAFNAIYNNLYGNLKDTVDLNTTEEVNHDFRNIISRIKAQ